MTSNRVPAVNKKSTLKEDVLRRASNPPTVSVDELLSPNPPRVLSREEWIVRAAVMHDMVNTVQRRRDEAIVRACAAGASPSVIYTGMKGRLTARRVRQVLVAAGIPLNNKPGRPVASVRRVSARSGLNPNLFLDG